MKCEHVSNLNIIWSGFWFSEKFSASTYSRCCVWTVLYWTMFLRKNHFFFVNSWWPTYEKCETQTTLGRNQHPLLLRPMLWKPRYFRARLSILESYELPTIFLLILVAANVPVRTAVSSKQRSRNWWFIFKTGAQRVRLDLICSKIAASFEVELVRRLKWLIESNTCSYLPID